MEFIDDWKRHSFRTAVFNTYFKIAYWGFKVLSDETVIGMSVRYEGDDEPYRLDETPFIGSCKH